MVKLNLQNTVMPTISSTSMPISDLMNNAADKLYNLLASGCKLEITVANNSPFRLINEHRFITSGKIIKNEANIINANAIAAVAGEKVYGFFGTMFGACWDVQHTNTAFYVGGIAPYQNNKPGSCMV